MSLRTNKILKLLALLLFTGELLASVFFCTPSGKPDAANLQPGLHGISHQFSLLSFLLCEEAGNEEQRDDKDYKSFFIALAMNPVEAVFGLIRRHELLFVHTDLSGLVGSQPPLIIILGSYRI